MKTISPRADTSIILSGGQSQVIYTSPLILKMLIGLDASLSRSVDSSTGLITGYAIEVSQFEGLFISFSKEKPSFSSVFKSLKFEVKRLSKAGLSASRELIRFNYLNRETDGKWFALTTLKTLWNSTYTCSGEFLTQ